jgi:hypothetical protein
MATAPIDDNDGAALLPAIYSKPGQLRQEYAVDDVLRAATEPAASIMNRRPPAPQQMFPQTRGFARAEPTILDVLGLTRGRNTGFFSGSIEPVVGLRNSGSGGDG